jgi:hypothetical protein
MTTTMTALNSANINHAEFIKLSVGATPTVYTFCNAAGPITVGGNTFTNLGSLLMLGEIQQEMKNTSVDLTISLTGIDAANVALVLSSDIKGSIVEVWRGFLDSNNQIITSPTTQFFKRYTGLVNNVSITENWDDAARSRIATCSLACTSMRKILDARLAGMKTNKASWQFYYPSDVSMDRVTVVSGTYFDFGKYPKSITTAAANDVVDLGTG